MNYIFAFLILSSVIIGAYTGRLQEVVSSIFTSSALAVQVAIGLIGIMAFWLGVVKIAEKSGLIFLFSKLISPFLRLIFSELPKNIALNISANALGLTNAATPFGINAMKDLKKESKEDNDTATNSMCMFLAMNTAGFQLVPAAVLGILVISGAKNPTEIIIPTFIVTLSAFIFAIFTSKIFAKFWKERAK